MSFSSLTPDFICDVIAAEGLRPSGQLLQLNSYENRVYLARLEDGSEIVAKFYRQNRWSEATLAEEHRVLRELEANEIAVIPSLPLTHTSGDPHLGFANGFHYCFFNKARGRLEADISDDHRMQLSRMLARIHTLTKSMRITHRLTLNTETYGDEPLAQLEQNDYLPDTLRNHLFDVIENCLDLIDPFFEMGFEVIPVHGDCHLGNVLWNESGPTLLDFDDMVLAPAVQDIWMLVHGSLEERKSQLDAIFKGYQEFATFNEASLILIEPLRTLRMIRHAAWIGARYDEEIFKRNFPYYTELKYWENLLLNLKEQWGLLQDLAAG